MSTEAARHAPRSHAASSATRSVAFANRDDLVDLDLRESLQLLRRRPLHFNQVHRVHGSESKMKPKIILRHHACAAVHFIYPDMLSSHDAHARADRRSIALRAHQLDLDPVLPVAPDVLSRDGNSFMFRINISMPPSLSKSPNAAPRWNTSRLCRVPLLPKRL